MARGSEQGDAAFGAARRELAERLRAGAEELERTINTRVVAIADPGEVNNPEYGYRLREAITDGIRFGIEVTERDEDRVQIPVLLLAQAQLAARCTVDIQIVLSRYVAAHTILLDAFHRTANDLDLPHNTRLRLLRQQNSAFERLLSAVQDEYQRSRRCIIGDSAARQASQVERLLNGEPIDIASIAYDFDTHHLALVVRSEDSESLVEHVATALGGRAMTIWPRTGAGTRWVWFSCSTPTLSHGLDALIEQLPPFRGIAAIGESYVGVDGWRLSHEQARSIFPYAIHQPNRMHRYSQVALVAAANGDGVLRRSLQKLYLEPIVTADSGGVLKDTLNAYFASGQNGSSAAAALGVTRQTVANRLRTAEDLIGKPLDACGPDIEVALRLPPEPKP